eukprot:46820_1
MIKIYQIIIHHIEVQLHHIIHRIQQAQIDHIKVQLHHIIHRIRRLHCIIYRTSTLHNIAENKEEDHVRIPWDIEGKNSDIKPWLDQKANETETRSESNMFTMKVNNNNFLNELHEQCDDINDQNIPNNNTSYRSSITPYNSSNRTSTLHNIAENKEEDHVRIPWDIEGNNSDIKPWSDQKANETETRSESNMFTMKVNNNNFLNELHEQ